MQLSTTFRHMEASQAVREYAEDKLDKFKKYFSRELVGAHAVFSVERNHNHTCEFSMTLPTGLVVQARETTEDMYSSIDLAAARIERQVRRWKDKIRDHKPHGGPSTSVRERVIEPEEVEPQSAPGAPAAAAAKPAAPSPAQHNFQVVKDERFTARSMTVEDAVMQLNLLGDELLVFTDAGSGRTSVLYRRKDGKYGLIETGSATAAAISGGR